MIRSSGKKWIMKYRKIPGLLCKDQLPVPGSKKMKKQKIKITAAGKEGRNRQPVCCLN